MTEDKKEEFAVWPVGKHHFRHDKEMLTLPEGWVVVPSGDSALTRRIKASGEYWVILGKYKNRVTKQGLCAPVAVVETIKTALEAERAEPEYQKKLESGRRYREGKQKIYVSEFEAEVLAFLNFDEKYRFVAEKLARAVTEHATPVGSGTVARTQRIPVEQRAEAAVIAWMRHQTTNYDRMYIVNGERRDVRRDLADQSRTLLDKYRRGLKVNLKTCPLAKALGLDRPEMAEENGPK